MRRFGSIWKALRILVLVVGFWAVVCGPALAAPANAEEEDKGYSAWVMAYMLVVLCIVLGMLFVLRSAKRRDRARPEKYAETKATEKYGKKDED